MLTPRAGLQFRALLVVVALCSLLGSAATASPSDAATRERATLTVRATQVSRTKVRTTVKVVVRSTHHGSTKKITLRLNPTGPVKATGKTITRRVTLHWKKNAYRGTARFSARRAGKVTLRGHGIAKVSRRVKAVPSSSSSRVTKGASVSVGTSGSYSTSVTVTPGYRRPVLVQRKVAGVWATVSTLSARGRIAVVPVLLSPAQIGTGETAWRVFAPATSRASAVVAARFTTRRAGTSTPPPTGDPARNCNAGAHWYGPGGDRWDETLPDCAHLPTISTVYDTWTLEPRCGLTEVCFRAPTQHERDLGLVGHQPSTIGGVTYLDKNLLYYPPDATLAAGLGTRIDSSTVPETLYLPGLVDAMNRFVKARAASYAADNPSWSGLQFENPFRPMWTPQFAGPRSTTPQLTFVGGSTGTIVVPGQGGFAQHWATSNSAGYTYVDQWNRSLGALHSCGQRPPAEQANCAKTADNNADLALNVQYPALAGHHWTCAEQGWNSGADGTADSVLADLDPAHYNALMSIAGYSSHTYVNFGAVRWPGAGAYIIAEMCGLVSDDLTSTNYGTLPGDTIP